MKNCYFLFLFLLISFTLNSQFELVKRLELPRKEGKEEDYEVFTLGKEGVLIQKETETHSGKADWIFTKYDTDFKQQWEVTFKIGYDLGEFTQSFQNQHYLFWLFTQDQSPEISILRLDLATGEQELFKVKLLDVLERVDEFKVLGNQAFIAGEQRGRAVVATFSFFNGSAKYLIRLQCFY